MLTVVDDGRVKPWMVVVTHPATQVFFFDSYSEAQDFTNEHDMLRCVVGVAIAITGPLHGVTPIGDKPDEKPV